MQRFDHVSGNTLDADGAAIYYETHGDAKDPVLLLLHGGLGNIEDFNGILPLLRGRFRIVGIDSRGHGRSTLGSRPLTYESLQHDAERIIAELAPDKFSILGFSDGGIVAYRLAAMQALRIERVATIGAHWELPPGDPTRELLSGVTPERWRSLFPNSYKRYQQLNPAPGFDTLVHAVRTMWLDDGATGYPDDAVDRIN